MGNTPRKPQKSAVNCLSAVLRNLIMFRRGPLKRGHESWGHEQSRRRGPMLTVVQIRALKPRSRPYKAFDSDGLFLLVQPSGSLLWRFRYRKFGIERKLSLGSFPDVTLQ